MGEMTFFVNDEMLTPIENLRNAIIINAVDDCRLYYKKMLRKFEKDKDASFTAYYNLCDVLKWFNSKDFEKVTGLNDGKIFKNKILEEIKNIDEVNEVFNYWRGYKWEQ